jgi:hypothetical protein
MPEEKSRFLKDIMDKAPLKGDGDKSGRRRYTLSGVGEQAFLLRGDYKDGRKKRGTAWSHFSDYEWEDLGDRERLTILFGGRIVTVEGHKLRVLYTAIDQGRLESFEEVISPEAQLLLNDPESDVIVTSLDIYPAFADLIKEIKGDDKDAAKVGFTQRFER